MIRKVKFQYTTCYVGLCMHNDHNRCKQAIPAGECDRRTKYTWRVLNEAK